MGDGVGTSFDTRFEASLGVAAAAVEARLDFTICTDNDARNVAFALAMRGETAGHCADIQIFIRMLDWSSTEHDALPGNEVVSVTNLVIEGLNRG